MTGSRKRVKMSSKLWDKGYRMDKKAEAFVVGEDYLLDMRLVKYDCIASIAHAKMLGKIGVLKPEEVKKLVKELNNIIKLHEKGKFTISKEQEDMHTAIENFLTAKLGSLGKKIHTGRSRNDQVLAALRLYYKEHLKHCISLSEKFIKSAGHFSARYGNIQLPGYTHTRKAMPSSVKLWAGSFIEAMRDNITLLNAALELVDQSPLGTGAGYGSSLAVDREFTAKELGFAKVQKNPIYVQMSRGKFEATMLHALTQVTLDINKMATDLIMLSMPEFGYYELPLSFTTGSSMMPNKKNPDILERLRANYHIIVAQEMQVKGLSGNLPTGYNFDIAFTKEPIIKGFDIAEGSLAAAAYLIEKLKVNKENCKKGLTEDIFATSKVYGLVKKGMPFRDAYKKVGKGLKN